MLEYFIAVIITLPNNYHFTSKLLTKKDKNKNKKQKEDYGHSEQRVHLLYTYSPRHLLCLMYFWVLRLVACYSNYRK